MPRARAPAPLEGLPIGIKDESEIKGKPTSAGSLILKDFVATETSTNNARIMRAGGHHPCPHRHAGVFLRRHLLDAAVGGDAQSVEPGIYPRRIVWRGGGVAGLGHFIALHRVRYRRFDPHSGFGLRRGRLQAALRAQPR